MYARLQSVISQPELEEKIGKLVTDEDYNLLVTRAAYLRRPDGKLLCVYLPGYVKAEMDEAWGDLSSIRSLTDNRGDASGTRRIAARSSNQRRAQVELGEEKAVTNRTRSKGISSAILGAFDPYGADQFCRLTAFTAQHRDVWERLLPLMQRATNAMTLWTPERSRAQQEYADQTHPDWVVPGTPFTTITVNNTYPTGVHTDKGDLDAGVSVLAVARQGAFTGGRLVFPQHRVAVDMQHGDLLLMDAHDYHGNTPLHCNACSQALDRPGHCCAAPAAWGGLMTPPERVSVVMYYRTKMVECGTAAEEAERRQQVTERRNRIKLGREA